MAFSDECTPASSRTLLITLKSKFKTSKPSLHWLNHLGGRVKLGTTCNKGVRICPRCTTPTAEFDKLGHLQDVKGCIARARSYLGDLVRRARDCVYHKGYVVNAAAVERMLHPMLLVPTLVRGITFNRIVLCATNLPKRMPFQKSSAALDSTHTPCLSSI
jgi:hypothetical protein